MPRVGYAGTAQAFEGGTTANDRTGKLLDFSTPAGWAMFWWFLSIAFIVIIYLSL